MTSEPSRRLLPSLLRVLVYGPVLGMVPGTIATASGSLEPWDLRLVSLWASSTAIVIVLGVLAVGWPGGRPVPRWLRALDLLMLNAVFALALGELALRVARHVAPERGILDDSTPSRVVKANRRCEAAPWFRYRCNSLGYPDEEFVRPGPNDYAVALIADSFGLGEVPWGRNFATLAERALREQLRPRYGQVAIDNRSVSGIDMPEYRYIVEREVLGRPYRQVVLCLFVGNDLTLRGPTESIWLHLARLQGWLPVEVTRRLWRMLWGLERQQAAQPGEAEPAFLDDPSLEPPYFTEAAYLEIERDRIVITLGGLGYVESVYEQTFAELEAWRQALGRRLLVVLIPDEFQVNDEVWAAALRASAAKLGLLLERYQRDLPQQRILAWADERHVRVLDLLPALRDAEREARTYHLRDTHWNAHGNRIAGRELANALFAFEARSSVAADMPAAAGAR